MKVQLQMHKGCEDLVPNYSTEGSAGLDLKCAEDFEIQDDEKVMVSCGFNIAIPEGYVGLVVPRSGLANKFSITVLNSPGIIDSDYRGELKVMLISHIPEDPVDTYSGPTRFERGDRIAQLVVIPVIQANLEVVDKLDETKRGSGGFGSTGIS